MADTEHEAPRGVAWKDVPTPQRYPDESRQRAIELARTGDKSVARIAADLGIATSCLRRWMKQDDIDGYDQPLFRLRWTGHRDNKWAFAIWLASKDGYERSVLPSGSLVGTVEEAMDCACGLYLGDISAWELPRQRFAPPH